MNADQKQRAADLLSAWQATAYALHGDRMANLLQELIDAPEVLAATNPAQISSSAEPVMCPGCEGLPANSNNPCAVCGKKAPAPSVPDGWQWVPIEPTPEMLRAGATRYTAYRVDAGSAMFYAYAAMLEAAPTPAEAPADLVRDAERWLSQRDLELLVTFGMQADDCDADGHTLSKEQTRRLCELGVLRNVGFGRHEMTAFGDSIFKARHLRQGISLPLQTHAEHNAARERQGGE